MNIFGFGSGSDITLESAGGVSLVADGTGPNLQTKGLVAGSGVTLTPGGSSVTLNIASGGAFLPLDGSGTMAGDIKMGGNSLTGVASVSGPTNSRTADNIVSNSGTGAAGSLASFVSNKVIQDAGITASNVVTNSGTGSVGCIPSFASDKVIQDTGILASNIVRNNGTGGAGSLASFASDKVIQDAVIAAADVVVNTGGAVTSGHLVQFSGVGGRLITTAGAPLSNYMPTAGGTFSGAVTGTSLTFSTTSGIIGTTTNNNAAAGSVGEYVSNSATGVALSGWTASGTNAIQVGMQRLSLSATTTVYLK